MEIWTNSATARGYTARCRGQGRVCPKRVLIIAGDRDKGAREGEGKGREEKRARADEESTEAVGDVRGADKTIGRGVRG